jgi:hypothetical protein
MSNPRGTYQIGPDLAPHVRLIRHEASGIAAVADGHGGGFHTCHPNISATGSVRGMKDRGYWQRDARTVRAMGYIYNKDELVMSSEYDRLAALACRCGGSACYRYQMDTGFRTPPSMTEMPPDSEIVFFAEESAKIAKTKADQALIPDEDAELVVSVELGILVYLDPEGLPPEGTDERKVILAEHVIDWFRSVGGDPDMVATFIDGERLIEKRDLRLIRPLGDAASVT